MNNKTSIKLKAAFLLVVFALNTLVSIACAMGVNMVTNSSHHHGKETTIAVVHIHTDGKKHIHHEEAPKHSDHKTAHHDQSLNDQSKEEKGNCCHDKVIKLDQLDKALAKTLDHNPLFFTSFIAAFYYTDPHYDFQFTSKIKYFVSGHHPPIPDIRVAIQSFQI